MSDHITPLCMDVTTYSTLKLVGGLANVYKEKMAQDTCVRMVHEIHWPSGMIN